jgi:hypothetical protein
MSTPTDSSAAAASETTIAGQQSAGHNNDDPRNQLGNPPANVSLSLSLSDHSPSGSPQVGTSRRNVSASPGSKRDEKRSREGAATGATCGFGRPPAASMTNAPSGAGSQMSSHQAALHVIYVEGAEQYPFSCPYCREEITTPVQSNDMATCPLCSEESKELLRAPCCLQNLCCSQCEKRLRYMGCRPRRPAASNPVSDPANISLEMTDPLECQNQGCTELFSNFQVDNTFLLHAQDQSYC